MQIVLVVTSGAIKRETPDKIVERVRDYGDSISYVLIDHSGGQEKPFNLDSSVGIYTRLKENFPEQVISFAGGFNKQNVSRRVNSLIRRLHTSEFGIDAQAGLRDRLTLTFGDDVLNPEKVRKFIKSAYSSLE